MAEIQRRGIKVLSNGAIYDLDQGRIVAAPPKGRNFITKENSLELNRLRWGRAREAAVSGAAESLNVKAEPAAVIREVFRIVAANLRDSKNSRGTAELARLLLEKSGLLPRDPAEQTTNIAVFTTEERTRLLQWFDELDRAEEGHVISDEEAD